jgi:hypothetical protein
MRASEAETTDRDQKKLRGYTVAVKPSIVVGSILLVLIAGLWAWWELQGEDPHPRNARAIEAGCDWLRRHQGMNGLWSGSEYGRRCIGAVKCGAAPLHEPMDLGLSGLALLALDPKPDDTAARLALPALVDPPAAVGRAAFNRLLPAAARRACTGEAAHTFDYEQMDDCHAGWALDLGADPARLLEVLDGQRRNGQTSTATIDAIRALVLRAAGRPAAEIRAALDAFADKPPIDRPLDLFLWYWAVRALRETGDPRLATWAPFIRARLLALQAGGAGCPRGSWDPSDPWTPMGGRVYATAMAVLTLRLIDAAP